MSLLKLSLLINTSIDSNYNYIYLYYSNSLKLYNKNITLSTRRKITSQPNTYKKNIINQRRNLEIDLINVLISIFNNILLTIREKTIIITKTLSLLI